MSTSLTRCWAEINLDALAANVAILKKFRPETMAVVKADAYGHDVDLIVPALLNLGISHFAVASVSEGKELRSLPGMNRASLYLMAAVIADDAEKIVELDLIPFATDTVFVRSLSTVAKSLGKTAKVHIEVDTGIGRAGIPANALAETLALWRNFPSIVVSGICTHFTAADAENAEDSSQQHDLFQRALNTVPSVQLSGLAIHAANSPAALRLPVGSSTLFRPGLLLYGIPPSQRLEVEFPFEPVLSLKARVLLNRFLPFGSDISYSRTYTLPYDAWIATVGIGYGDGFPRRLSNSGHVLLPDGTFAPVRGRVCMDQVCVEVPESANLKPGAVVTLIGKTGENEISAADIAWQIDATPHEITTCLTSRIPRILESYKQ